MEKAKIIIITESTIEVDAEIFEKAQVVFARNGLSLERAIALFLEYVACNGKLPFEVNEGSGAAGCNSQKP